MNLFSQNELLIMVIVVGSLLIIISYLTFLDIMDYLKSKKGSSIEKSEDVSNVEIENFVEVTPPVGSMTEVLEEIEIIDFDDQILVKKEEVSEVNQFKEESSINYFVELTEEEVKEQARNELERVSLELSEMENKDPFEDTITNFEIEQEENAIISLDELTKIGNSLYDSNEVMQYDDGDEPITIDEVISKFNNNTVLQNEVDNTNNILINNVTENHAGVSHERSQNIPLISNVYDFGKTSHEMEFENTANYEKLDMEMRRTNDFLNSLKDVYEKSKN